jgi:RNase P/RNase MRP subunit p29
MNFFVLTEEDDLIKFHVEGIAGDVFDDGRETLVLRQVFEMNGIVGREIFVFWFNAWEK